MLKEVCFYVSELCARVRAALVIGGFLISDGTDRQQKPGEPSDASQWRPHRIGSVLLLCASVVLPILWLGGGRGCYTVVTQLHCFYNRRADQLFEEIVPCRSQRFVQKIKLRLLYNISIYYRFLCSKILTSPVVIPVQCTSLSNVLGQATTTITHTVTHLNQSHVVRMISNRLVVQQKKPHEEDLRSDDFMAT